MIPLHDTFEEIRVHFGAASVELPSSMDLLYSRFLEIPDLVERVSEIQIGEEALLTSQKM